MKLATRKKITIIFVTLAVFFLSGSWGIYKLVFPMPYSVKGLIDEDLSNRVPLYGSIIIPEHRGVIGAIIPDRIDSKLHLILNLVFPHAYSEYTYEKKTIKRLNTKDYEYWMAESQGVTQVLCISVQVTNRTLANMLINYNYLAYKVDGEWVVTFLDNKVETCE